MNPVPPDAERTPEVLRRAEAPSEPLAEGGPSGLASHPAHGPAGDLALRGGLSPEAARDLVRAFRMSAEALNGVRDLQAELVKSLKQQDRSELVLQSTQALNETFRGLATLQRALLQRLEQAPRGTGRLVPLMLLGLLAVSLGGIYLVVDMMDRWRSEQPDLAALQKGALDAFLDGRTEGAAAQLAEVERLQGLLAETAAREEALRAEMREEGASTSELEAELDRVIREREELSRHLLQAQNDALLRRAVEEELRDASGRLAVLEPRLVEVEREREQERRENQRLRQWLASLGRGLPEPAGATAAGTPASPSPAAPSPSAPPSTPTASPASAPEPAGPPPAATTEQNPEILGRIRQRLNEMLTASGRGRAETWQVRTLGGVTLERLHDVVLVRYDARGTVLDEARAKTMEIWVDRDRHQVEMVLGRGEMFFQGLATPFRGGELRKTIAEGEMMMLYGQSGFPFVRYR
jgi:hypothetical protein